MLDLNEMKSGPIKKSVLITRIAERNPNLTFEDVDVAIRLIIDILAKNISERNRIEIRGFGVFRVDYRKPRIARNPKTGEKVYIDGYYYPRFKPGLELKNIISRSRFKESPADKDQ